ncbi:MAG TPA: threonine synthase [Planctomycetota bacterium]|nr:threonine synthase [Planctomycetota bacterium]
MASRLVCADCARTATPGEPRVTCACGGLYEVQHPAPTIGPREFAARRDFSGVWRFLELVDPDLDPGAVVSLSEGRTPLLADARLTAWAGVARLELKHEGRNPTGSFKDRGMTVAVSRARANGVRRLACASTGNTAASLAAYAAAAGLACVVLAPEGATSRAKLAQAQAHGARMLLVRGDFDRALALLRAEAESGTLGIVNSIHPYRLEGQKTIVLELLDDLGWSAPDWIAFPAGNLGNAAACGKALREARAAGWIERAPRLLAVQAAGAAPFAAAFERGFDALRPVTAETVASAIQIGAPASYARAVRALRETNGVALAVSDADILEAKAHVDAVGIGCEPASAAALAGVRALAARGELARDAHVVCVLTGHLLKDPGVTAAWHAGELLPEAPGPRHPPLAIEATREALHAALERSHARG